ncbi:MAG: P-type conjugative transfer protein TrbL [Novosphingobium pentaromativorans]|uniref:P-type conjugative transfer protein TrbL n=1 Tax=Novosphingobium pentaromativorans TaxID=205844 RepID=A0A2W5ND14_9SPHN|nr:P-type conjugative transfer protein TrbL [Novosphingobium panipatense]PZQ50984.1 MAG: P-type conjugative transfer protein TrbL [Novosphingobium pentaromativorans]
MGNLNIIDAFLATFIRYIDSGFGLLGGDVRFLTGTLIAIDVTLAALFWTLAGEDNVLARFVRKILFVGAFAFIIGNFSDLADILFRSFSQAGLTAGGGALGQDDLMKPGRLAGIGFSASWPLLLQASKMLGFTSFFNNFLTIAILLLAWLIMILAFFVLAVQMFVCILEFKLVSLAGFILVPFALWNRTSFLAERVLGHVVGSGIKVMVLAVIVGIGSTFFDDLTQALKGQEPDIGQAMSLVLASLSLLGLGIFAPSVASGLASGAPQLGAGAVAGTAMAAGGTVMMVGGGAVAGARMAGAALGGIRTGTSMGAAASSGVSSAATSAGSQGGSGSGHGGSSLAGPAAPRASAHGQAAGPASASHADTAPPNTPDTNSPSPASGGGETEPAWAKLLRSEEKASHRRQLAVHAVQQGDRGGGSTTPDISERND